MIMSKVSILLPFYNYISRLEQNYLAQMLSSILAQTHEDFEVLLLDNQSTDQTQGICQQFASKDKRIKFMVDDKKRSVEEAINKLIKIATGDYIMGLCDDDLINTTYLQKLVNVLDMDSTIHLAYTNGMYINENNHIIDGPLIPEQHEAYSSIYVKNVCSAIHRRCVLPIVFGMFRKEAYQSIRPCTPFDVLEANEDNLFMIKFFLHKYNAYYLNENLFYYRDRPRKLDTKVIPGMPTNPLLIWCYYIKHQLNFYNAIATLINETTIPLTDNFFKLIMFDGCCVQMAVLLKWVRRDLIKNKDDKIIADQLDKMIITMLCETKTKFSLPISPINIQKAQERCELFISTILPHIQKYIPDNIITDTKDIFIQITTEFNKWEK